MDCELETVSKLTNSAIFSKLDWPFWVQLTHELWVIAKLLVYVAMTTASIVLFSIAYVCLLRWNCAWSLVTVRETGYSSCHEFQNGQATAVGLSSLAGSINNNNNINNRKWCVWGMLFVPLPGQARPGPARLGQTRPGLARPGQALCSQRVRPSVGKLVNTVFWKWMNWFWGKLAQVVFGAVAWNSQLGGQEGKGEGHSWLRPGGGTLLDPLEHLSSCVLLLDVRHQVCAECACWLCVHVIVSCMLLDCLHLFQMSSRSEWQVDMCS